MPVVLLIVISNRLKVSMCRNVVNAAAELGFSETIRETLRKWGRKCDERPGCCGHHLCQPEDTAVGKHWKLLLRVTAALWLQDYFVFQRKWTFPLHPFNNTAGE